MTELLVGRLSCKLGSVGWSSAKYTICQNVRFEVSLIQDLSDCRQLEQKLSNARHKLWNTRADMKASPTLASLLTWGLLANCTSVAFRMVFCSSMAAWDRSCPNGWNTNKPSSHNDKNLLKPWLNILYPRYGRPCILDVFAHLFTIETLIKYHPHGPNIDLGRYFWRLLAHDKTFWRKIPAMKKRTEETENQGLTEFTANSTVGGQRSMIRESFLTYQYVPAPCDVKSMPYSGL